jgi:hypothetical protein
VIFQICVKKRTEERTVDAKNSLVYPRIARKLCKSRNIRFGYLISEKLNMVAIFNFETILNFLDLHFFQLNSRKIRKNSTYLFSFLVGPALNPYLQILADP